MATSLAYKVWDRYWKVELETSPDTFEVYESPNFWVEFDIKHDGTVATMRRQVQATITIFNANPNIINTVKANNRITLYAGYRDNKSMIFRGVVKGIKKNRKKGDIPYKIQCIPSTDSELGKYISVKTIPPEKGKPDWINTGQKILETIINDFTTLQIKYITESAATAEITNYTDTGTLDSVLERLAALITSKTGVKYVYGVIPQLGWFYFAEEGEDWGDEIYIMHDIYDIGSEVVTQASPVSIDEVSEEVRSSLIPEEEEEESPSVVTRQYRVFEMPLNPAIQIGKVLKYIDNNGATQSITPQYVEHVHDGTRFVTIVKELMQ